MRYIDKRRAMNPDQFACIENAKKRIISRAEGQTDKWVLTKDQEQEVKSLYEPYFDVDLTWHNYITLKTGQFDALYLPEDIYYYFIDYHFNNHSAAKYLDNKCYYERMFPGVCQPHMVVYRMNGLWFEKNQIISENKVIDIIRKEPELFLKQATESYGGHGVFFIARKQYASDDLYVSRFYEIVNACEKDYVVQRPVSQHSNLALINESSLNTVRLLSLLSEKDVKIYSAILRMGVAGSKVDNATSGGITCGIDEEGRCRKKGYYSYSGGVKVKRSIRLRKSPSQK